MNKLTYRGPAISVQKTIFPEEYNKNNPSESFSSWYAYTHPVKGDDDITKLQLAMSSAEYAELYIGSVAAYNQLLSFFNHKPTMYNESDMRQDDTDLYQNAITDESDREVPLTAKEIRLIWTITICCLILFGLIVYHCIVAISSN